MFLLYPNAMHRHIKRTFDLNIYKLVTKRKEKVLTSKGGSSFCVQKHQFLFYLWGKNSFNIFIAFVCPTLTKRACAHTKICNKSWRKSPSNLKSPSMCVLRTVPQLLDAVVLGPTPHYWNKKCKKKKTSRKVSSLALPEEEHRFRRRGPIWGLP